MLRNLSGFQVASQLHSAQRNAVSHADSLAEERGIVRRHQGRRLIDLLDKADQDRPAPTLEPDAITGIEVISRQDRRLPSDTPPMLAENLLDFVQLPFVFSEQIAAPASLTNCSAVVVATVASSPMLELSDMRSIAHIRQGVKHEMTAACLSPAVSMLSRFNGNRQRQH